MSRAGLTPIGGLLLFAAACAQPTPEQTFVTDAVRAIGGRERLMAVGAMTLTGEGRQYNLGQDVRPGARGQVYALSGLTRHVDLTAVRARTELTRRGRSGR